MLGHLVVALALLGVVGALGCAPDPARPSILLVVLDTLRADAVSSYGPTPGTTPALDALAADGTRYTRAFAPSSWTLPSHASLMTGLEVERHGVGLHGRMRLPEELVTLAERLAEAGYQNTGLSENFLVAPHFGLGQGFSNFSVDTGDIPDRVQGPFDLFERLELWEAYPKDAPFFLFVNLFDPHHPYEVRDENPFLREGVSRTTAASVQKPNAQGIVQATGICDELPPSDEREILRALYLGDVHAADTKLARVLEIVRSYGHDLITIVVSDHGEHMGENRLLGHEYSVHNAAIHVPLVVHGAPDLPKGESDAPVTLADVPASILDWVGLESPEELDGRPLPPPGVEAPERRLVSFFSDAPWILPETIRVIYVKQDEQDAKRDACGPEDRVFGDLVAVMEPPYKLIQTPGHPSELYDLRWDLLERSDIAKFNPEVVARLEARANEFRDALPARPPETLEPEAAEALRALGYGQ